MEGTHPRLAPAQHERQCCSAPQQQGGLIEALQAGSRLAADPNGSMRLLHPAARPCPRNLACASSLQCHGCAPSPHRSPFLPICQPTTKQSAEEGAPCTLNRRQPIHCSQIGGGRVECTPFSSTRRLSHLPPLASEFPRPPNETFIHQSVIRIRLCSAQTPSSSCPAHHIWLAPAPLLHWTKPYSETL